MLAAAGVDGDAWCTELTPASGFAGEPASGLHPVTRCNRLGRFGAGVRTLSTGPPIDKPEMGSSSPVSKFRILNGDAAA
eukprot:1841376-Prymnesium_polylepis.1